MTGEQILVLGGARSGKSLFAQGLAAGRGERVLFVATLVAGDEEMSRRIAQHRRDRPAGWRTIEAPTGAADALSQHIGDAEVVLLDCLTLMVYNMVGDIDDGDIDAAAAAVATEVGRLLDTAQRTGVTLIVVSNEVGMGLVPPYPMGRAYRDLLGRANQLVAQRADRVYLMVAGLPLVLKAPAHED
ncbi:MAG: bifunctional adenosylcobinamide kinase/adenosylcobinamide-phosphate guanylyltransferase [Chloroflexota bacterium]|nr:bifunctional adenosylcobinamide kinase/adenosylcobinamide-phosphate guanylyltransferase [Chloroflexota bacterium]